jgi:hypothetical protein
MLLQNPRKDHGTIRILRDAGGVKGILFETRLDSFLDLDQHFIEGLRFRPGERVVVAVNCRNPAGQGRCAPSVTFVGRVDG